jgi:hypothetical protein
MSAKAAEMQREVRENAEDYQNYLKDLYLWESDIKLKDEMLKKACQSPNIDWRTGTHLFCEAELTTLTLQIFPILSDMVMI